jgi:hypothetical protein
MLRFLGLAAVLTAVVVVLPAASVAANHQTFSDAIGDDSQGFAPDITALDVTATDDGGITFKVSINEQNGTFYVGDTLEVLLNTDNNASTGSQGAESGLFVFTSTGKLDFEFCNFNSDGTRTCSTYASNAATDVKTGSNAHVVTFSNSFKNWTRISLAVVGLYQDPKNPGAGTFTDRGPDHGEYVFDLNVDPDGDGITGTAEGCPSFNGGPLDTDHDGCPPTLPVPKLSFDRAGSFGGYTAFSRVSVSNAPRRTSVLARFAGFTSRRTGPGALPGVSGRRLRIGSLATFIFWRPGAFGEYQIARVTARGFAGVRQGCTLPGSTKFMSCAARFK